MSKISAPRSCGRTDPVLVAVGANLSSPHGFSPLETCRQATHLLKHLGGLQLSAVSFWYSSAPVPRSDQPPYVNGVVKLEGKANPEELLKYLQEIENEAGRRRSVPNAARSLDLDLLAMGELVWNAPDLIIPHPRLHQRSFVLLPLADVAPEWVHPLTGRSVPEMIGDLPPEDLSPEAICRL